MGNSTKVALVALLILMVVVIARFVRNDSGEQSTTATTAQPKATQLPQAKPPESGKPRAITVSPSGGVGSAQASANAPRDKAQVALQPPRPVPSPNSNVPVTNASSPNLVVASSPPAPLPGSAAGAGTSSVAGATQPPAIAKVPGIADAGGSGGVPQAAGGGSIPPRPAPGPSSSQGAEGIVRSGGSVPPGIRPPSPINAPGGASPLVTTELKTEASRVLPSSQSPSLQPGQGPAAAEQAPTSGLSQHFPRPQPVPGGSPATPSSYPLTYTVEKNDSYWVIAQKQYKDATLWQTIEKANPGVKLIPGKTLSIPAPPLPKVVAAEDSSSDRVPGAGAPKTPRITLPDMKSSTARAENAQKSLTPIARIAQQGKQVSQETKSATVPSRAKVSEASVKTAEYVVKRGDTLSRIAKRFYNDPTKYDLIEDANANLKYGTLQEGAKLVIPLLANQ